MSEQVLFVDDEQNVLGAIQRTLHRHVEVQTASSAGEALKLLEQSGPFALVISDMRMPVMNGAQFLAQVREKHPDTVRMILSGQSDLQATIAAVNDGHIYRFLSKPCAAPQLLAAVSDGITQHRLLTAEKVLLEQTLSGSVKMLIEILGLVAPAASSRASRLQRYTIELAAALGLEQRWQWGLAAFVSQIGCVALPKEILQKIEAEQALSDEERRLYDGHPEIAGRLLAAIPRLDDVAAIVGGQFNMPELAEKPDQIGLWDVRSVGQLLLRTSIELDRQLMRGAHRDAAIETLRTSKLGFPASVIHALRILTVVKEATVVRQIRLLDLAPGMVLDEDLFSTKGIRLVPAGLEVTRTVIVRLMSIAGGVGVTEPFRVRTAL